MCDLLFPEQCKCKSYVEQLRQLDEEESLSSSGSTMSVFGKYDSTVIDEIDFACPSGVEGYLRKHRATTLNTQRIKSGKFRHRLDMQRHSTVPALYDENC